MASVTTLAAVAERLAHGKLQPADAEIVLGSHDLVAVGVLADEIRRRVTAGTRPSSACSKRMSMRALDASCQRHGGEFRLTGRPASLAAAVAATAAMRRLAGAAALFECSLADLEQLGDGCVCTAERRRPGWDRRTADRSPRRPGPVRAARNAGLLVLRLTVDSAPADLLQLFAAAKALSDEVGGFQAFAPLPPAVGHDADDGPRRRQG